MTRNEILEMEPGYQLDMLVEETVFGCVDYSPKKYSTDISAAWEVVEKMQTWGGCDIGCYGRLGDRAWYVVDTHAPSGHHNVTCHTAPEAICKAALLAVMEEQK